MVDMSRREFITLLGGAAVAWPLGAHAQTTTSIRRVGVLDSGAAGGYSELHYWSAYYKQMQALGYVEGRNVVFDVRWADRDFTRLPDLTVELERLPVSVIVALSTAVAQAARSVTTEVPIVVPLMADPVAVGLVASLARPGGNVTGLSTISAELSAKRLELLREIVPNLSRAAIIWSELHPAFALTVRQSEIAAQTLGVSLHVLSARAVDDLEKAVAALVAEQARSLPFRREVHSQAVISRKSRQSWRGNECPQSTLKKNTYKLEVWFPMDRIIPIYSALLQGTRTRY